MCDRSTEVRPQARDCKKRNDARQAKGHARRRNDSTAASRVTGMLQEPGEGNWLLRPACIIGIGPVASKLLLLRP